MTGFVLKTKMDSVIIGKRFLRSTHLLYYPHAILKLDQVDFFSHRCHGPQRPLTRCPCNNMGTSLEYAFLDLHVFTIKNNNTQNLVKSIFFTLHHHRSGSLTSLPFKSTGIPWSLEFGIPSLIFTHLLKKKFLKVETYIGSNSSELVEGILKPHSCGNSVHPSFTGMETPLKPDKHICSTNPHQ
jgi:hypothetical protein